MHTIRQSKPTVTPTIKPTLDFGLAENKQTKYKYQQKSPHNALVLTEGFRHNTAMDIFLVSERFGAITANDPF